MVPVVSFKNLVEDIDSMMARDPAARSRLEVVIAYPGFQALLFYRLAHRVWRSGWKLTGRFLSHLGRWFTGVEIHPAARIGRRLFIDHGMGVVIGETAEIGDDVTLYHGVTLGGVSPSVNAAAQANHKRHPTLRDGVIVGSGAQVLGPITVGEGARVGANAVVVSDVGPGVTVVGIPAKPVVSRDQRREFMAYGTPVGDLPDPVAKALDGLLDQVSVLKARIDQLEHGRGNGLTAGVPDDGDPTESNGDEAAADEPRPANDPYPRRVDC